jgi:hypothetical protein
MEIQSKTTLETLINNVPTDVSGKWVKKEDLSDFAVTVADYVLSKIESNINDYNFQTNSNG